MLRYLALILAFLLSGCQSTPSSPANPGKLWIASIQKDEFTDVEIRMVTVGAFRSRSNYLFTKTGNYYPFIGSKNGEICVGIRSGGTYRIPTGTVQIRIDENPAWTITPDETPVDMMPSANAPALGNQAVSADIMATMTKFMSPYTATTDEKAKQIVRQMLQGRVVRYRTIGLNQAASTTGEVLLDASFAEGLRAIGIDTNAL